MHPFHLIDAVISRNIGINDILNKKEKKKTDFLNIYLEVETTINIIWKKINFIECLSDDNTIFAFVGGMESQLTHCRHPTHLQGEVM